MLRRNFPVSVFRWTSFDARLLFRCPRMTTPRWLLFIRWEVEASGLFGAPPIDVLVSGTLYDHHGVAPIGAWGRTIATDRNRRTGEDERQRTKISIEGTCWCGGTVWQGRTATRISVSNWRTTEDDVERSIVAIVKAARLL
jgi:hypothetical protein